MRPRLDLLNLVDRSRRTITYFWFLVGEPQEFDRYQEANHRAQPKVLSGGAPEIAPALAPADVAYYGNPFDRLARMHTGEQEMSTGFAFATAWSELHW